MRCVVYNIASELPHQFAYVLCPFAVFHKNGQLATMLLADFLVGLYQNIYMPYSSIYLSIDLFIYLFAGLFFYIIIHLQGMTRLYKNDNKRNKIN